MKREIMLPPAGKKLCVLVPGILLTGLLLMLMTMHLQAALAYEGDGTAVSLQPAENYSTGQAFLPQKIPGTDLVAERLCVYDGPFLEDGSLDEVTGINALVVTNQGKRVIADANISLWKEGECLTFRAQSLLPGQSVLVLEANRQKFSGDGFERCEGSALLAGDTELRHNEVQLMESGMAQITIINRSGRQLHSIRLIYKGWLEPPGIWVGGVCYVTEVASLSPGESITVTLRNYAPGYSRIIRITGK